MDELIGVFFIDYIEINPKAVLPALHFRPS